MNIWHKFMIKCSPFNSVEEYEGARKIHISEIKIYRKQWQYILGLVLFALPFFYFLWTLESLFSILLLSFMPIGVVCIKDTICEHYCRKIYRESDK